MPPLPPRRRAAEYCGIMCWGLGWLGLFGAVVGALVYPLTRGFENNIRLLWLAGGFFVGHVVFLSLSQVLRILIDIEAKSQRDPNRPSRES
jgi:hypothetical protein